MMIVFRIFLAVGVGLLAGAFYWGYQSSSESSEFARAEGTVVDLQFDEDTDGGGVYRPLVEFVDAGGSRRTFLSSYGSYPAPYDVGDKVGVLYNPANPSDATMDSFGALYLGPVIVGSLGLVFTLIGGIAEIYRARRKSQIDSLQQRGKRIEADFVRVNLNTSIRVNGRSPYRIECQWLNTADNRVYNYTSENIWYDPSAYLGDRKKLTVYIDPNRPKVHWMDTGFLPKKA
jgi:hypothetical protein